MNMTSDIRADTNCNSRTNKTHCLCPNFKCNSDPDSKSIDISGRSYGFSFIERDLLWWPSLITSGKYHMSLKLIQHYWHHLSISGYLTADQQNWSGWKNPISWQIFWRRTLPLIRATTTQFGTTHPTNSSTAPMKFGWQGSQWRRMHLELPIWALKWTAKNLKNTRVKGKQTKERHLTLYAPTELITSTQEHIREENPIWILTSGLRKKNMTYCQWGRFFIVCHWNYYFNHYYLFSTHAHVYSHI